MSIEEPKEGDVYGHCCMELLVVQKREDDYISCKSYNTFGGSGEYQQIPIEEFMEDPGSNDPAYEFFGKIGKNYRIRKDGDLEWQEE